MKDDPLSSKTPETEPVRWGVLGTGKIAAAFAEATNQVAAATVAVVASRDRARAELFARRYGVPTAYDHYGSVLGDAEIEAVYVALPNSLHHHWTLQALRAGKHVLCEKPLGTSATEVAQMVQQARASGLLLCEAMMYRYHPQVARLQTLLRSGLIGRVVLVRAEFGFAAPFDPQSRLFQTELGGGAILDVGCYPISIACSVAGCVRDEMFVAPTAIVGATALGPTGVDEAAVAQLTYASSEEHSVHAQIAVAINSNLRNALVIHGTQGTLSLPRPWAVHESDACFVEHTDAIGRQRRLRVSSKNSYVLQLTEVSDAIRTVNSGRLYSLDQSILTSRILEAWARGAKAL